MQRDQGDEDMGAWESGLQHPGQDLEFSSELPLGADAPVQQLPKADEEGALTPCPKSDADPVIQNFTFVLM